MDNYKVSFVFDYCVIVATCQTDDEDSAPDLAADWVLESLPLKREQLDQAIDIVVEYIGEE